MISAPEKANCPECDRRILRAHVPGRKWESWISLDDEIYLQGFTVRPIWAGASTFEAVQTPTYRVHSCSAADVAVFRGRQLYVEATRRKYLEDNNYRVPPRDGYTVALQVPCPVRNCGAAAGEKCSNLSAGKRYRGVEKLSPHDARLAVGHWVDGCEEFWDRRWGGKLLRPIEAAQSGYPDPPE